MVIGNCKCLTLKKILLNGTTFLIFKEMPINHDDFFRLVFTDYIK